MDDTKQQIVDSLKQANNILVTVRNSPSLDQLAACIALTLVLNDLNKHATAVFSGEVPSVLEFLEPGKTIERDTDSLQDFIISLDKAKADKLRYKVEDSVVKIFITPYKTSITEKDLEFGQGDFNVDVVVALGVHNQDDLDQAITSHGQILHDATVISMNTEPGGDDDLGTINWVDTDSSSLSEMVAGFANELGKEDAIDNQVATALLTGVVAETERFGNAKTTPATMEIAAKLLTAGANQELVASKLAEPAKPEEEHHDQDNQDNQEHNEDHHDDNPDQEHHEGDDNGDNHPEENNNDNTEDHGEEHHDGDDNGNDQEHHDNDGDGNHGDENNDKPEENSEKAEEPPKPSEPGTIEISHPGDDQDQEDGHQDSGDDGGIIPLINPSDAPQDDANSDDSHNQDHQDQGNEHHDESEQKAEEDNDGPMIPAIQAAPVSDEPSEQQEHHDKPEPADDGGSLISALPLQAPQDPAASDSNQPQADTNNTSKDTDDTDDSDGDEDDETEEAEEDKAPNKQDAGQKMMTHHAVIQPLPDQQFDAQSAPAPAGGLQPIAPPMQGSVPDLAGLGMAPVAPMSNPLMPTPGMPAMQTGPAPMLDPSQQFGGAPMPNGPVLPPALTPSPADAGLANPLMSPAPVAGAMPAMPPAPAPLTPSLSDQQFTPLTRPAPLAPAPGMALNEQIPGLQSPGGAPSLSLQEPPVQSADMPQAAMVMPSDLPQTQQLQSQMPPMGGPMGPPMGSTPPPPAPPPMPQMAPMPGMPMQFNQ